MSELKEKLIAKLKTGKALVIHYCSMCGYPCNFNYDGEGLCYDSGCYCVSYINNSPCDWDKLDFYLEPNHGHIAKIEKFISEEQS